MRGKLLICLFSVFLGVVAAWLGCSDDPPTTPNSGVTFETEDDGGARRYDWAIGPIEGVTTVWHPVPDEITVPVGTTLKFKCAEPVNATVAWINVSDVTRSEHGSIASVRVSRPGRIEIAVERSTSDGSGDGSKKRPGGQSDMQPLHRCVVNAVAADLGSFALRDLKVSASPLLLTESSNNFETMRLFFAGGVRFQAVSQLTKTGPDRYVTASNRLLWVNATASDERFSSLVEMRVAGERPHLGTVSDAIFSTPGEHVISAGPPSNPRRIVVETYEVAITRDKSSETNVPEGEPITFHASTTPPGYERYVTWLSSTRHGSARPVVGHGASFTVTFNNTWGPHDEIPDVTFQWLGVRADNAVFNQDVKDTGPRCDNCAAVVATLYECFHWADDANGTACKTDECIENQLNSASCQYHPERTGNPQCNTKEDTGGEVIQRGRTATCPGGTVNWVTWMTLYYGCGTVCNSNSYLKSCETASCTGTLKWGPDNRGTKKKCGC